MSDIIKFARLDFLTMKRSFGKKQIMFFLAIWFVSSTFLGMVFGGIMFVIIYGMIAAIDPFLLNNECNIDMLYQSLAIKRRTVVLGRYVFSLVALHLMLLAGVGLMISGAFLGDALFGRASGVAVYIGETSFALNILLVIIPVCAVNLAVQMAVFFKYASTNVRAVAVIVPMLLFVATAVIVGLLLRNYEGGEWCMDESVRIAADMVHVSTGLVVTLFAVAVAALAVSCALSAKIYKRREF